MNKKKNRVGCMRLGAYHILRFIKGKLDFSYDSLRVDWTFPMCDWVLVKNDMVQGESAKKLYILKLCGPTRPVPHLARALFIYLHSGFCVGVAI